MHVPRGGETTYHGPGQLIAYPIVNLRQLKLGARAYVEALEDIMIATAGVYGVSARVCCVCFNVLMRPCVSLLLIQYPKLDVQVSG